MAKPRTRLDALLVERGLADSVEQARGFIMAGDVFVAEKRVDKAGTQLRTDSDIRVRGTRKAFVSRGGLKLDAAIEAFGLPIEGRIAIDVGASTGGFTDCLLSRGAERVYAVDVGYGQLAWKLRQDPRVVCLERTNIRHLEADKVDPKPDLAVIDCSFISLTKVVPPTLDHMTPSCEFIVLVKPQFEVSRQHVGDGVIRDEALRQATIDDVSDACRSLGLTVVAGVNSSVHGPKGNVEHLLWLRRSTSAASP